MKLLSYTYRKLALLLFLLMAVWGVLFYYAIIDEVVDETDDTLENYGEILMESALHDPSILETEGSLMSFYKFTPISEEEGRHYRQVFYDATVYIELEDEDEPVRVMCTAFRMPDGQYYELKLMISILERDDMVEAMLWYLGALFLLFLICTSIGIQLVLKGVFRPLHRLLDWLHCIQPGKGQFLFQPLPSGNRQRFGIVFQLVLYLFQPQFIFHTFLHLIISFHPLTYFCR